MADQVPPRGSPPPPTHLLCLRSRRRSGYENMSSRESYDEKSDIKSAVNVSTADAQHHLAFKTNQVDTGAQLVAGEQIELDPAESIRIRKKIDRHILPLMCSESLS